MAILTMLTDLGLTDPYLAMVKGKLLSSVPDLTIIDISHDPESTKDEMSSAYILRNAVPQFPRGTIHVISVLTNIDFESRFVLFAHKGHYFIGLDSGVFFMLLGEHPEKVYDISSYSKSHTTFALMDILAPVAIDLLSGKVPSEIGAAEIKIQEKKMFYPTVDPKRIVGSIMYVDEYGNLVTNISKNLFESTRNGRKFRLFLRSTHYSVTKISNNYNDVTEGEIVGVYNYAGLIEIAMFKGNCARLLGVALRDSVVVEFTD